LLINLIVYGNGKITFQVSKNSTRIERKRIVKLWKVFFLEYHFDIASASKQNKLTSSAAVSKEEKRDRFFDACAECRVKLELFLISRQNYKSVNE
jgi:hypothetical protein